MNKTLAVLSYPNSNNLGDFIQSEAVKQYFKNQIVQELDRDQELGFTEIIQPSEQKRIAAQWFHMNIKKRFRIC